MRRDAETSGDAFSQKGEGWVAVFRRNDEAVSIGTNKIKMLNFQFNEYYIESPSNNNEHSLIPWNFLETFISEFSSTLQID